MPQFTILVLTVKLLSLCRGVVVAGKCLTQLYFVFCVLKFSLVFDELEKIFAPSVRVLSVATSVFFPQLTFCFFHYLDIRMGHQN